MRRSILFLSLVAAAIAVVACSSATAPTSAKQPGPKSADVSADSVAVSVTVCASGWQSSTGRCL